MSETWNWKINRKSSQLRIIQIIWVKNKQHNRKLAGCDLMTSAQSRQDEMKNSVTIWIVLKPGTQVHAHTGQSCWWPNVEFLASANTSLSYATHLYWNWLENNFKHSEKHSNMWNSNSFKINSKKTNRTIWIKYIYILNFTEIIWELL